MVRSETGPCQSKQRQCLSQWRVSKKGRKVEKCRGWHRFLSCMGACPSPQAQIFKRQIETHRCGPPEVCVKIPAKYAYLGSEFCCGCDIADRVRRIRKWLANGRRHLKQVRAELAQKQRRAGQGSAMRAEIAEKLKQVSKNVRAMNVCALASRGDVGARKTRHDSRNQRKGAVAESFCQFESKLRACVDKKLATVCPRRGSQGLVSTSVELAEAGLHDDVDLQDTVQGKASMRTVWAQAGTPRQGWSTPSPSHSPVTGPADSNVCLF